MSVRFRSAVTHVCCAKPRLAISALLFVTDPLGMRMYLSMGKNSDGLELVRAMRGSKVETANLVAERALIINHLNHDDHSQDDSGACRW